MAHGKRRAARCLHKANGYTDGSTGTTGWRTQYWALPIARQARCCLIISSHVANATPGSHNLTYATANAIASQLWRGPCAFLAAAPRHAGQDTDRHGAEPPPEKRKARAIV